MKRKVILSLLFLSNTLAVANEPNDVKEIKADEWVEITTSTTGTIWILRGKDLFSENKKAWFQLDHSKDKTISHRKTMQLIGFDYDDQKYAIYSKSQYHATGTVENSWDYDSPEFVFVRPGTVFEDAMTTMCQKENKAEQ